ncbi:MAG TPA: DUF4388 domain-containing protein [Verrucomicrobiae bacterium]|nr:DUF4388 domain-containing protein [Verrucomicrobiae bacterium]
MKALKQSLATWLSRGISRWLLLFLCVSPLRGDIVGPYTPDPDTLHLWHFNETAVPVIDVGSDATHLTALRNGATLGSASTRGFGLALNTFDAGPGATADAGRDAFLSAKPLVNGPGDNVLTTYAGQSGAFSYEALVRIDFDPQTIFSTSSNKAGAVPGNFMQILNFDADEATNRVCQFRLVALGLLNNNHEPLLEFINLSRDQSPQSITAKIPTTGPDAMARGSWYHVAVTYDGNPNEPDNLKFYWSLLDDNRTNASLIGSGRMSNNLPVGCQPDLAVGQTGRQSPISPHPNNNFVGAIDEVRVSGIARSPAQMMFGAPAPAIAVLAAATTEPPPRASAPPGVATPEVANLPAPTEGPSKSATWLIPFALGVIAGLLTWLAFALKRLLNTAATRKAEVLDHKPEELEHTDLPTAEPPAVASPSRPSPPTGRGVDLDDNVDRHTTALEFASEGFHGVLRKVGLQDLIQMECLNQRSSVLEIISHKISGLIYMERGDILHATAGKYSGEKAFIKLFSLRSGEFNLKPFEPPTERTINCHWIHLLLEAARQRDEDTVRLTRDKLAFSRTSTNTEDILNMAAMLADHPQVTEILVCSPEGKVLYNSKCRDQARRASLCQDLVNAANAAATVLPLGEFDQIEILRPDSKTLIRGDQECHLLIGMDTTTNG